MKKLTSERLGREGLAAWEDRKSNNDPEVPDINETTDPTEDADISTDPDVALADQPVDAESQAQRGSIIFNINIINIIEGLVTASANGAFYLSEATLIILWNLKKFLRVFKYFRESLYVLIQLRHLIRYNSFMIHLQMHS